MNTTISSRPNHRRQHAGANRVGAEARPDGLFFEIGQRRGQRSGSENQREVRDLFLGEAAGDPSVARDAPVDSRRGLHLPVEDDGEIAADVLAGHLAEPRGALGVQREAHRRPVVLVERWPRAPQIATGDGRGLAHQVEERAAARVVDAAAHAGNDFHPVRRLAVDEQRVFRRRRTLLDDLQLEEAGRPDDFLRAVDIGHARQLHEDLIVVLPLLRDARFGDAELVDAALDRLARLGDRFFAQAQLDVRLHRERVGPVDARVALEIRAHLVRGVAEGARPDPV